MITNLKDWKNQKNNKLNESESLTPSWSDALGEYQKLRDIVQNSSDQHLKDEFRNLIEIYFHSNMAIQPEEVYLKIIPEIKELLDHPDTKITESDVTSQIVSLYKSGKSQSDIASELNLPIGQVIRATDHLGITVGTDKDDDDDRIGDDPSSKQYYDRTLYNKESIKTIKDWKNYKLNENSNRISLPSKDDVLDVFPEKGYVTLKQKNSNGQREMVIIDDEIIPKLIEILQSQISKSDYKLPRSSQNREYNGPQYQVGNKISQDLADLVSLAVQTKGGLNYDEFIKAFDKFEQTYNIVLIKPSNGTELIKANDFEWDDEKDFQDTEEDKQDITARWYKAFRD